MSTTHFWVPAHCITANLSKVVVKMFFLIIFNFFFIKKFYLLNKKIYNPLRAKLVIQQGRNETVNKIHKNMSQFL